ncbi:MAG: RNase adapter RapZ [Rubellimicrobium sp.]|nr:RNase adapter RapZ [Rubellimicrobium sp.]
MTDTLPHIPRLVLVTGPSGAGRTTAINALEDLGHEVIDNLPLSLLPRLTEGPPLSRPLAIGLGVSNRDFSAGMLLETVDHLAARPDPGVAVVFLDCDESELLRRFAATRRRHPLDTGDGPLPALQRERAMLAPLRARADILIETDSLSPHDLAREIAHWFAPGGTRPMAVSLHSFSYRRGLPRGLDLVFDTRFLRNPHWVPELRALDGRDARVADWVAGDPRYAAFREKLDDLILFLLPAARDEGKAHLAIGIGCTGGQHRSVTVVESLAQALAAAGWPVSKRHRELEGRQSAAKQGLDW